MDEPRKITISASILLHQIIEKLYVDGNGNELKLPFLLSYKLQKNKDLVERDLLYFKSKQYELLKDMNALGENDEVKVPADKTEKYQQEIMDLLKVEVKHTFAKIDQKDLEYFKDCKLSSQEMALLVLCLIDDPELFKDLASIPGEEDNTVATDSNGIDEDDSNSKSSSKEGCKCGHDKCNCEACSCPSEE